MSQTQSVSNRHKLLQYNGLTSNATPVKLLTFESNNSDICIKCSEERCTKGLLDTHYKQYTYS